MSLEMRVESDRLRRAMAKRPSQLAVALNDVVGRTVLEVARTARRRAPKATSRLVNAIGGIQTAPLEGLVLAATDYAQAVEDGTGVYGETGTPSGRMPPVANILDWIRVARILPDDPDMDQADLAFVIARNIARSGTPAQPFMEPAFERHRDRFRRRIEAAVERVLQ